MKIILSDAGKRFNREWIFRHFDFQFFSYHAYAITGSNGSGKSTLLQFIAGALMPSEGKLAYYVSDQPSEKVETGREHASTAGHDPDNKRPVSDHNHKPVEDYYKLISIAAPYLETIEEMTATEFFRFHQRFKPLMPGLSIQYVLGRVGLADAAEKQIRYYSSGMKQRIKLAQAFFSDTPVILLDEPTTNLDASGIALYHELIRDYCSNRLVIVSSNDPLEYSFCKTVIDMKSLK